MRFIKFCSLLYCSFHRCFFSVISNLLIPKNTAVQLVFVRLLISYNRKSCGAGWPVNFPGKNLVKMKTRFLYYVYHLEKRENDEVFSDGCEKSLEHFYTKISDWKWTSAMISCPNTVQSVYYKLAILRMRGRKCNSDITLFREYIRCVGRRVVHVRLMGSRK